MKNVYELADFTNHFYDVKTAIKIFFYSSNYYT